MSARMRSKPLLGGPFGLTGRYQLASVPGVSLGLDSVQFAVVEARAGLVLSIASAKVEALAAARRLLAANALLDLTSPADEHGLKQAELFADDPAALNIVARAARQVSRRRREVFERSEGRCRYCSSVLTLDGAWHVEHALPRALGGGDDARNLVASCPGCNLAKRDRTGIEFIADASETQDA